MEGLKYVAETLGKRDWNITTNSCMEEGSIMECNCTYINHTVCHITTMYQCSLCLSLTSLTDDSDSEMFIGKCRTLTSQNLEGTLPSQLFRLPYLEALSVPSLLFPMDFSLISSVLLIPFFF